MVEKNETFLDEQQVIPILKDNNSMRLIGSTTMGNLLHYIKKKMAKFEEMKEFVNIEKPNKEYLINTRKRKTLNIELDTIFKANSELLNEQQKLNITKLQTYLNSLKTNRSQFKMNKYVNSQKKFKESNHSLKSNKNKSEGSFYKNVKLSMYSRNDDHSSKNTNYKKESSLFFGYNSKIDSNQNYNIELEEEKDFQVN